MRLFNALPVAVVLAWTPAVAEEKPPPEDKIICKRNETHATGSHLSRPKKVCMKASEWKLMQDETDRTMRQVQDGKLDPDRPAPLGGGPG